MITLLIIAGFLGLLAPVFGFIALFVGGLFMVSIPAGCIALVLVFLLIAAVSHIKN
jgi:hypothetical protein